MILLLKASRGALMAIFFKTGPNGLSYSVYCPLVLSEKQILRYLLIKLAPAI